MEQRIKGTTGLLALIGSPVGHSGSPDMYNFCFRYHNLDYSYMAFDIKEDQVPAALDAMRLFKMRGCNVTMPCKTAAAQNMDELSPAARIIGAVNTIVNENGKLIGHMTDGIGFVENLRDHGVDVKGKKLVILGAGGAATAIQVQCALDGATSISIFNPDDPFLDRAKGTAAKLKNEVPDCNVQVFCLDDPGKLKEEIEKANRDLEYAESKYDLESAARLRHGVIPALEKELEELKKNNKNSILSDVVDDESIAAIIAKWTNIPISKLVGTEKDKLLHLEDNLKKRVKGQDKALHLVSEAIIRARAGIKDPNRPIGSFIFLGPTGVGKTEVAKALAYELFDDERHMVRIDMSEYMEPHSVARLIGSPPGYVGYDDGGQLTEAVRRNPYSIVLFDEIEKAHKDVFNILLQILDDGRITDSQGRTVDFKNTIIIMTSNLGSDYILEGHEDSDQMVMSELRRTFKPEFINRIDEIVVFNSLSKEVVYQILDKIISEIEYRLRDKKLTIKVTDKAKDFIVDNSYDEKYGARPIKRYVSRNIETLIAKAIINEDVKFNSEITIDVKNDKFIIK